MDSLLTRYRNVSILAGVLFLQVIGLGVQVRRKNDMESSRLIRVWVVSAVTPLEKGFIWAQTSTGNLWRNYLYLRGVRDENRALRQQIEQLRLEQVRLSDDAHQARRLQALLGFKEQFISKTVAAQVIGSSGSVQSRTIYIDKGERDGLAVDLPVITAEGIVGKVLRVYNSTSQVLLINDQTSGAGAILESSRLQGILRGSPTGQVLLEKVMADEQVHPGDKVLTSGGDQVFPKGLPVGTVMSVEKGRESFLDIRIKPAANLSKIEEVLIITEKQEREPSLAEEGAARAVDILADRLPSVPQPAPGTVVGAKPAAPGATPASGAAASPTPASPVSGQPKPPVHKTPEAAPQGEPAKPPAPPQTGASGQDQ
ncbi:MAG: rod shape-determining protein MreC [Acidobacteria bacterium]|nr:rod shape-determining protein MreC [Acidobacteriota bacterium]